MSRDSTINAHQRTVSALEDIVFGELEPGSPLPSETELAAALDVSRLTVREAVKSLQARGLIEVRHGRRPVVAALTSVGVEDFFTAILRRDPRSVLDLLETRRAVEIHIASLAAGRASRTALRSMAGAIDDMRAAVDDAHAFNEADVRFHEALATGSANQILNFLIEAMARPLGASRVLSRQGLLDSGHRLDEVIAEHERIYSCVRDGDAAGAAQAMRIHLEQTERSLRVALEDQ